MENLMEKMLTLDPEKRISIREALDHVIHLFNLFRNEEEKKNAT
jgi:serine/threonine protein kinase